MARLMIHRDLLKQLGALPVATRKKVSDLIEKFHDNSKSAALHLEPYSDAIDRKVRSARVDQAYRAIVIAPEQGDTFLLMYVDHHDKAYRWCRNKRFEIHGNTGVLQIFDVEEVQRAAADEAPKFAAVPDYPLARLNDEQLFHAGVPEPLLPAVRAITSDSALDALTPYLPRETAQVLSFIACGLGVDEALAEVLGPEPATTRPAGPGDFRPLVEANNQDLVFIDGEDQLRSILQASLEEWRVFLHPYQRKIVEWQTRGPAKVNGAAGTGKTVVLMHRAVHLAERLASPNHRILVTTFTTNLSATIKGLIGKLARQRNVTSPDRIEVTNLHDLARTICLRAGWRGRVADSTAMREVWEGVLAQPNLASPPLGADFLREEYDEVVDPMGIVSEEDYLTAIRTGRSRLSREQRRLLWPFIAAFQRELKRRGLLTFEGMIHEARLVVERGTFPKYEHVLVDEIQDFGLEALRLVKALSPAEPDAPNSLFVAGDGHQRIYKSSIPLSRAGIDVRGRSRRLKINYRTTEQIRGFAQQLIDGVDVDDLDGSAAITIGDRSMFKGPQPEVRRFNTADEEAQAIAEWVKQLVTDGGFQPHEICVAPWSQRIRAALNACGLESLELQSSDRDPEDSEKGVRLATMHRIKGLEFKAVALALFSEEAAAPDENPLHSRRRRCLHYVAATRAQRRLLVCARETGG